MCRDVAGASTYLTSENDFPMSKDFEFTTEYPLDKHFFEECYDQTSRPVTFPKSYLKGLFFLVFGVIVVKFELLPSSYLGWFFIVLSVVEFLNVFFKKSWWVWRQTYSTGSGSKVIFKVDSDGVSYESNATQRTITWSEISQLEQTERGFILHIGKQRQYLSKSCLNEDVIAFMIEQCKQH